MQENQTLTDIKRKIFGGAKEPDILDIYHYLMIHYGYIPFEDFKKMDAHLVDELIIKLNKMNEKANKKLPKGRR